MPEQKLIRVSVSPEGVALVTFSRPPVNAFNRAMWTEIPRVFNALSQDSAVRVVVLASTEKFFTAGLDLTETDELVNTKKEDPSRTAVAFTPLIKEFQVAISSIENCRVPVIAAIHSIAYGIALDILSAVDIRLATANAVFSIKEIDIGMASDVGTLARIEKIVGNVSMAREWAVSARDFGAEEALRAGFLSRVVKGGREEVLAEAIKLAKVIASKSPIAVTGTKHLLLHARDHSVAENLAYTATWNSGMLQSADVQEAIASFTEKRKPSFKPLGKL